MDTNFARNISKNLLSSKSRGDYSPAKNLPPFFGKNSSEKLSKNKTKNSSSKYIKGMKVLAVDSDRRNLDALLKILANEKLNISVFTDWSEAFKAVQKERFDLILVDIDINEIESFEFIRNIKDSSTNSISPILFMSSDADPALIAECYNFGCSGIITKPFDKNVLHSQVVNLLKTKYFNEVESKMSEAYIAMLTHDFKSPINSMYSALSILDKSYDTLDELYIKEVCGDMFGSVKYLKDLLDNSLKKYKYKNDEIVLNKEPVSLKNILEEVVEECKYTILEKNLTVKICSRAKTKKISADRLEVKRVMHNLISNAAAHTPKNSVIEIDISENKKYMVFSIKNPYYGNIIEQPETLFNKFVSHAMKNKTVSSGLGLYIAKSIVDAHGGSISADIRTQGFIRFVFTIPK